MKQIKHTFLQIQLIKRTIHVNRGTPQLVESNDIHTTQNVQHCYFITAMLPNSADCFIYISTIISK